MTPTQRTLHRHGDLVQNRYQIHALIGQGGMGETYQAEDVQQRQWVALKVMSLKQLGDWDLLDRFEREAKILETIDHPGVPDYVEHFRVETEEDCRFYLAQEFASGKALDRWVKEGWRATEAEVKRIAAEVLDTLEYLHGLEAPVIHRDIKPQNIIRQHDGRIYLVDFGAVQSAYHDKLQAQGTFIGTLGYMPPEQLRGQATFASDLYALGATLVYLLTHRNPDELPMQRMKIHFQGRVKLSAEFSIWLERMLEPRLKNRFASAKAARLGLLPPPVAATLSIGPSTGPSAEVGLVQPEDPADPLGRAENQGSAIAKLCADKLASPSFDSTAHVVAFSGCCVLSLILWPVVIFTGPLSVPLIAALLTVPLGEDAGGFGLIMGLLAWLFGPWVLTPVLYWTMLRMTKTRKKRSGLNASMELLPQHLQAAKNNLVLEEQPQSELEVNSTRLSDSSPATAPRLEPGAELNSSL